MNDWKRVLNNSIIESEHFTIDEAKVYALRIKTINGGINA